MRLFNALLSVVKAPVRMVLLPVTVARDAVCLLADVSEGRAMPASRALAEKAADDLQDAADAMDE